MLIVSALILACASIVCADNPSRTFEATYTATISNIPADAGVLNVWIPLPTSRAARFSGGLSVTDFLKRTSIVACTPDALAELGPAAVTLAEAEGLGAHARSVSIRFSPSG